MAIVEQGPALRDYENIVILQSLLRNSTIVDLPERYVWTQALRRNLAQEYVLNEEVPDLTLPIIDVSCLLDGAGDSAAKKKVSAAIGAACADWGFFQIINHGIPDELFKEVDVQARKFFALPVEVKEKAKYDPRRKDKIVCGYNGRLTRLSYNTPWMEYLADRGNVEQLTKMIWPEGNPALRCTPLSRIHVPMLGLLHIPTIMCPCRSTSSSRAPCLSMSLCYCTAQTDLRIGSWFAQFSTYFRSFFCCEFCRSRRK